tara:strand:- start:2335 stop:3342 length:1008 start_codon:yes stop_codon:yes gene_type:complete
MDKMKKILVTGADGFIGSHLVEFLIKKGFDVRAFCLYNSFGSRGWLDSLENNIKDNIEFIMGDVRDSVSVKNAVKNCKEIYHLAALIAIPYSYRAPASYIDTNIHGTLNIVEAARDLNVDKVVHTSTSETYGTAQFVPITESHPLVGQSPYAASKIGADQIALSYWRSFETPISIIRPFNTYGPRQSARAVIPTIISQIINKNNQIKLGALSPTRDFNFVEDICAAFHAICESKNTIGKVINASSKFEVSIGETANIIKNIMNSDLKIICEDERLRPKNSEVNRLFGDNTLLKELTNWEPKYASKNGFEEGLKKTIKWFIENKNILYDINKEYLI